MYQVKSKIASALDAISGPDLSHDKIFLQEVLFSVKSFLEFVHLNELERSQVQIAGGENTAKYWPNPDSQESAIVIGPVSLFASVKCWADDGGLLRLFKYTDLQPKLGPVSAPVRSLKQVLAARVWARIGGQLHTGVIIPATARYWQPIFGKLLAILGQYWAVSNFAHGMFLIVSHYISQTKKFYYNNIFTSIKKI